MLIKLYLKLLLKCIISIFCLFIIVKKIGKREIKNQTLFDHIITITIGNFIAEIILNGDNFIEGIIVMFIFGLTSFIINHLTVRSNKIRKIIDDDPVLLIESGKIIKENLKKNNITLTILEEESREEGIKSLKDVKYAVFEINGNITFYTYEDKYDIERNIIIDGTMIDKNIKYLGLNEEDVLEFLKLNNTSLEDTFLLTYQNNKFNLYKTK